MNGDFTNFINYITTRQGNGRSYLQECMSFWALLGSPPIVITCIIATLAGEPLTTPLADKLFGKMALPIAVSLWYMLLFALGFLAMAQRHDKQVSLFKEEKLIVEGRR